MEHITLDIQSRISTDIFVAGGGTAGCAAAIAAAREGAKVILADQWGTLGGSATLCLVSPVGSIASRSGKSFGGLPEEIFKKVDNYSRLYAKADNCAVAAPHLLKYVLLDMVTASGVKLMLHSRLIKADTENGIIKNVYLHTKSGIIRIDANYFIDATGDADLVAFSGDEWLQGCEKDAYEKLAATGLATVHYEEGAAKEYKAPEKAGVQPASSMFILGNVDSEKGEPFINKMLKYEDLGITKEQFAKNFYYGTPGFEENGDLVPLPQGRVLFFNSSRKGEVVVNMSRVTGVDSTDVDSLTYGEIWAQKQVIAITDFLRKHIPGFENCRLIDSSNILGVRESRRLVGSYVLSGADVIDCVKFPDTIAHGSYSIDIHDPFGKKKAIGGSIRGDYYSIPYRCIISAKYGNLAVSGRCISADHVAHSSTRVQGTCIATGEAAGTAAALCFNDNKFLSKIDINTLQSKLRVNNVFLDNER